MNTQYPLRERRKRQSRSSLITAAMKLFSSKGYDETTLEEVAEQAGLHVQTLYRHFANKSELTAAVEQDLLTRFQIYFVTAHASKDTFALWREWVERCARMAEGDDEGDTYRVGIQTMYSLPSIPVALLKVWSGYEDLLTQGLADDFGMDPEQDALPRLVAGMLWAGNAYMSRRWATSKRKRNLTRDAVQIIDEVRGLFADRIVDRSKDQATD